MVKATFGQQYFHILLHKKVTDISIATDDQMFRKLIWLKFLRSLQRLVLSLFQATDNQIKGKRMVFASINAIRY